MKGIQIVPTESTSFRNALASMMHLCLAGYPVPAIFLSTR